MKSMSLQRKLPSGDCAKWRTVTRFSLGDATAVQAAARILAEADDTQWRIVTNSDGCQREIASLQPNGWVWLA